MKEMEQIQFEKKNDMPNKKFTGFLARKFEKRQNPNFKPKQNINPNQNQGQSNNPQIKVIPLGGVEEIGMNSTAIEFEDKIIVVDAGLGFPENDQLGIDYLIPNYDYLIRNKHKIKGIFITHGHLDHIGSLHILLPELNFPPVYASTFAAELIKVKLEEEKMLDKVDLKVYKEHFNYDVGKLTVTFFKVTHSTPDSYGIIVKTPLGNIVHTGDFKMDNSPVGEDPPNYLKLAQMSAEGVLVLLSDSTNSFKPGYSKSEAAITDLLQNVVEKAEGRIIVATFAQLVNRINQLIQAAISQNRKIAISGRSMEKTISIARKLKYIIAPDDLFVPLSKIGRYNKERQMILATGHQGENMAALSRIARGEHKDVQIQKGDTVILSASVIPGNDLLVQNMIDDLSSRGARVFHQGIMDLHAGGHGYKEDQKLMINLTKPKFFIPVHGYQSFLAEHMRTAQTLGIPENHTILPKDGKEIVFDKNGWSFGKQYRSKPVIVSGFGVGDVGDQVLAEREQLANAGVIILTLLLNKQKDKLLQKPYVKTRGFIFVKDYRDMITEIESKAEEYTNEVLLTKPTFEDIRRQVERKLAKFINKRIGRDPMIVTIIP